MNCPKGFHVNAQIAYALMTHPTAAMRRIRTVPALGTGIVMLLAGAVSNAVAFAFLRAQASGPKGAVIVILYMALVATTALATWLFLGGLIHAAANLMGGYGNFGRFLAALGLAAAPFILCTPCGLLLSLLGGTGSLLYSIPVLPLIVLWAWILVIIGIKEIYALSAGGAVVASLLPLAIIVVTTLSLWSTALATVLLALA